MSSTINAHNKKILIADDNDGIVASLALLLKYGGYEVTSTTDGEMVKEICEPFPDLILLDIHMEKEDGLELCAYLKGRKDTRNIPIVMISASPDSRASALTAGADDFIEKPYTMNEMLSVIEKQLRYADRGLSKQEIMEG